MPKPVACPGCFSMNKPSASRCRVCGLKLKESSRAAPDARPVVLERVMSGEVFTAVIGRARGAAGAEIRDVTRRKGGPSKDDAETAELRRILGEYEARFRAAGGDEAFDAYGRPRRRRRRRSLAPEGVEESLETAMDAFRGRRYADVIGELEELVLRDDTDPRAWVLLGEAHLKLSRPHDAAAGFTRALDLAPRNERGWLGLAKALRSLGDPEGALGGLDRALAIDPDLAEAWFERGLALEMINNLAEALRSFAKALELRPDHGPARAKHTEVERRLAVRPEPPLASPITPADAPPASAGAPLPPPRRVDTAAAIEETILAPAPAKTDADIEAILGLDEAPVPAPAPAKAPGPPAEAEGIPEVALRPAEPVARPARLRTFVEGLDEALDGGVPWGHVVLVQGMPGTMKSSLGFSVLLHNAREAGLHGLYLSLEERAESLLKQMASLGLPLKVTRGSLVFIDPKGAKDLFAERHDWIASLERALAAIKKEKGLDLIVIDSLEALEVLAKFKDRRREMYRLFEWLRDLGITSFVITERPDWVIGGQVLQGRWDEDFLADGVVQVRLHMVSDLDVQRRIRILKMRGTRHATGYLAFVLDEGRFKVMQALSP